MFSEHYSTVIPLVQYSASFPISNLSQDLDPVEGIEVLSVVEVVKLSVTFGTFWSIRRLTDIIIKTLITFHFLSWSKCVKPQYMLFRVFGSHHYFIQKDIKVYFLLVVRCMVQMWIVRLFLRVYRMSRQTNAWTMTWWPYFPIPQSVTLLLMQSVTELKPYM